jgi:hypothetical protein
MRLAFITSLVPQPSPETGFEIANRSVLNALHASGAEVTVFGYRRKGDPEVAAADVVDLKAIEIETSGASRRAKLNWIKRGILGGAPLASAKLRIRPPRALFSAIDAAGSFDGIVVNGAAMAGAYPRLLKERRGIFLSHNVEHVSARQNAAHAERAMAIVYRREARLIERVERRACADAAFAWFFTAEDMAQFPEAEGKAAVLPLLTPAADAPPAAASEPDFDIGLIGTWTWRPNQIGLQWFARDVLPLLPATLRIGVAGRLPSGVIEPRGNLVALGRVPDAAAFVRSCRVMALASTLGTGVQLKAIEVLELGRPAVATAVAMRGILDRPPALTVADDPRGFADGLLDLLARPVDGEEAQRRAARFVCAQREGMARAIEAGLARLR